MNFSSQGVHRMIVAGCMLGTVGLGWLVGCASNPGDGLPIDPPPHLGRVPDAVPRIEPLRQGGPNKPYQVQGRFYQPLTQDVPFTERGVASWYGTAFHGQRTATGEVYDMYAMTAAHPTLPLPSYVRVRNPANGREVIVRVNDRGPFHANRAIDLSYTAALKLDLLQDVGNVEIRRITWDEIRRGVRPSAPALAPVREANRASSNSFFGSFGNFGGNDSFGGNNGNGNGRNHGHGGYWVQLGAFSQADKAAGFQHRVAATQDGLAPSLKVFNEDGWYRLQTGPYPSRSQAQQAALALGDSLQVATVVVERR